VCNFSGVAFQPEILGSRLYLFIYLFIIYLLLASPCVLLYYMAGHQNLYGPSYVCVCVCFFPWVISSFLLTLVDAVHGMFSF
jgi:hypothetical protein